MAVDNQLSLISLRSALQNRMGFGVNGGIPIPGEIESCVHVALGDRVWWQAWQCWGAAGIEDLGGLCQNDIWAISMIQTFQCY